MTFNCIHSCSCPPGVLLRYRQDAPPPPPTPTPAVALTVLVSLLAAPEPKREPHRYKPFPKLGFPVKAEQWDAALMPAADVHQIPPVRAAW